MEERKRRPTMLLALGLVCAGCGSPDSRNRAVVLDSAVWTPQTVWRLSEAPIVEIRGDGERTQGKPLDPVSVNRLADGRYVVGDGNQNGWDAILVYSDSGQFVQQLGRSGEGPGEFGQLYWWAGEYRGDSIAAYDQVGGELQIFSQDGTFGRTLKLSGAGMGRFYGVLANGNALIGRFNPIARALVSPTINLFDPEANEIRELYKIPRSRRPPRLGRDDAPYFGPLPIYHVGRAHLYRGESEQFRIEVYDTLGQMARVLQRDLKPDPLTADDREQIIQVLVKAASGGIEGSTEIGKRYEQTIRTKAAWPEFRPAFGKIIEDPEGNVWIEHYRFIYAHYQSPQPTPTAWSVFDPSGQFLGEVIMPASFLVSSITRDQVLGFWLDEFDVQHVRVYRLTKPVAQSEREH
jgi:hypothetical protein